MLDPDLLWHWQRTSDPLSALRLALPFLMGATLGATLALACDLNRGPARDRGEFRLKSASVHSLPAPSPAGVLHRLIGLQSMDTILG